MSFDDDTALRPAADGTFEGTIDGGWWTPRGPLGGYVMAIVLRGMQHAVGDPDRMPRSATMHFLRTPKKGDVVVRAEIEREGRSLTSVSARLEQDGRLMGLALGAFSKPWEGPLLNGSPMPEVAPPDGRRPVQKQLPGASAPPFLDRLSMQRRFGPPAFSGADRAIHFRAPLPIEDTMLLARFRTRLVRDGFFEEDGQLWAPDGTLVAQSRQLGLLIGVQPT